MTLLHSFLLEIQSSHSSDVRDGALFALISFLLIFILAASGRVQMGFVVPGFPTPLRRSRKKILSEYFPFYKNLPSDQQKVFGQRVQAIILSKTFYGRGVKVDEVMRVLISACAVQLTFGLPKIMLSHFTRIIIYPNDYYSTINKQYHKGEINPRLKAIVLSWHHFLDGYVKKNDGINLGLHEMAHALHLENIISNDEYNFLDQGALAQWRKAASEEMMRINSDPSHLFRSYASVNEHEFFAIAVENFFERSEQFNAQLPHLYHLMTLILRQNPLSNSL